MARMAGAQAMIWETPDPTLENGSREQRLVAYRAVRDHLDRLITANFSQSSAR
jgi:hypothetical protein